MIPIVYGLPTEEAREDAAMGKIKLGGCVVGNELPLWHCSDCKYQWGELWGLT